MTQSDTLCKSEVTNLRATCRTESHTEGHLYNFPVLFFTILMRNMQQNIHQIDTDGGTVYLSNVFLCQRDDYWKFEGRHASWLLD